jgi:hypothetical protein
MSTEPLCCIPRSLPDHELVAAAKTARDINPANHAPVERLAKLMPGFVPTPQHIAIVTSKYWGTKGVKLTVGFLDNPPADLRKHILAHMNAWGKTANTVFRETKTDPQVRIARQGGADGGYWSYLGTDILHIGKHSPTLNLEAFTMNTPESEFHRVVRHETGHTLGFPHEHLRKQLVKLIDKNKAIAYFGKYDGWSPDEVTAQVLTPLEESSIMGTPVDQLSIMCYQIPGSITVSGKPIIGGLDIDKTDYAFAAKMYPKAKAAPAAKPAKKTKARKRRK